MSSSRSHLEDWIARAMRGDQQAFDLLFARALPRLQWFIELRLGGGLRSRLEPDDVVQETYAAAVPLLESFEFQGEARFVRWLMSIARNQIRRLVAAHAAPRRAAVRMAGPADAAISLAMDPASGPCTRAERVERRLKVASALGALPEPEREVLLLRILEGRPLREVAQEMGRSESAVRRLVAKAVGALGQQLQGEGESHAS